MTIVVNGRVLLAVKENCPVKGPDMFRLLLTLLVLTFTVTGARAEEKIIKELVDLQRNVRSMKAEFVQEKHTSLLEKAIKSRGRFLFKSPNSFLWDYEDGMRIVSDGRAVLVYYKGLQEAELFEAGSLPLLPGPFSVELLMNHYDIKDIKRENNRYVIKLQPIQRRSLLTELTVEIDNRGLPLKVELRESGGDSTIILFKNRKLNPHLPDELFSTEVPEGIKVRRH